MRVILFCIIVQTSLASTKFGTSYLGNSRLCKSWSCINSKLGLKDELPTKERFAEVLRDLVPDNSWQETVDSVVEVCYGDRPRRYTNTCPGQSLLYCAVDNLIEKCPEEFINKEDACAPPSSLAGFKFMFSQSRYVDFRKNLPYERRPVWFLENYFNSKCCSMPEIFNSSVMSECGFSQLINYIVRPSQRAVDNVVSDESYNKFHVRNTTKIIEKTETTDKIVPELDIHKISDPLDCCDLTEFIPRTSRYECDFKTSWTDTDRLSIEEDIVTTTPAIEHTTQKKLGKEISNDVKVVPVSCEATSCVFRKLQILDDHGSVNTDAFSKLLDNMTDIHSEWRKAKARVVTKCLTRRITEYDAECEINKVLACTFDLLTENCPFAKSKDQCKHSYVFDHTTMCQISSSKFRPKHRRQFCGMPPLVSHKLLEQCDVTSLSDMVFVPYTPSPPVTKHYWQSYRNSCKDMTKSTKCVLNSMGVINKYGFLDYFKMKDRIRSYSMKDNKWSPYTDLHLNAFMNYPLYGKHCNSPKKFLNVIDTMLMTCPSLNRRNTEYCKKIFDSASLNLKESNGFKKITESSRDFHHFFAPISYVMPRIHPNISSTQTIQTTTKKPREIKTRTVPEYNFWVLNSNNVPPIKTISVTPSKLVQKLPLTMLPVYKRYPYVNDKTNDTVPVSDVPMPEYQDTDNSTNKPISSNEEVYKGSIGGFEYPQMPL